jgi:transmembrane protein TMEM254
MARIARTGRNGVTRPSWFWFLLLDGGIVVLTRLALSKQAYDKAGRVGGDALPPREVLQVLLVGTAVVHAGEALAAGRMARRRGLPARGWRLQTFIVGFPSLFALRRSAPAR